MSENFESTYENSLIPENLFNEPVFVNSGLKGDYEEDYYSTLNINNPVSKNSSDTINFFSSGVNSAFGQDNISFSPSTFNVNMPENVIRESTNGFWKYEEDLTLKEVQDYLSGTYRSHYTSQDSKTQTLDLIESIGDGEAFCRSNAIKYLSRFGKKNGKSKMDILKAIHYCILLYHFAGLHKSNTTSDFPY